jgi:hypothetical protein
MEQLLKALLEEAKKSRKSLIVLKNQAVICNQYELASEIREMEKELFPETEEEKAAKEHAKQLKNVFMMFGLNVPEAECWTISKALDVYKDKGKEISLKDAAIIKMKAEQIFLTD